MPSRNGYSKKIKLIAVAALVCVRLGTLFGQQNDSVTPVTLLVGTAARHAVALLPAFFPAIWPTLQGYVSSVGWSSFCLVYVLASYWPLVHWVAGAL
jgi:hypothetical protein